MTSSDAERPRWSGPRAASRPSGSALGGAMLLHLLAGVLVLAGVRLPAGQTARDNQTVDLVFASPAPAQPPARPARPAPGVPAETAVPPPPAAPSAPASPPPMPSAAPPTRPSPESTPLPRPPIPAAMPLPEPERPPVTAPDATAALPQPPPLAATAVTPPLPVPPLPIPPVAPPAPVTPPIHAPPSPTSPPRRPSPAKPPSIRTSPVLRPQAAGIETTAPPAAPASAPASQADETAAAHAAPPAPIALDWQRALAGWLAAHKTYPDAARRSGTEGSVVLRFSVDRSGRVLDVMVVDDAGAAVLGAAAQAMLRGATLPAFPATMSQDKISVTVRVRYTLTD